MLISQRKFVAAALVAAAAGLFVVSPGGAADDRVGAVKLQGAWVAKVVGMPAQWSYVVSPDASGRRAAIHGSIDVGFTNPLSPDSTPSPLIGELVMTGPDTARVSVVWYGIEKTPPGSPFTGRVVFIGTNTVEAVYDGPGKGMASHHLAFYLPTADADGDGLPDPGQTPVVVYPPVTTIDTRVPAPR